MSIKLVQNSAGDQNQAKSEIYGVAMLQSVENLATVLWCKTGRFPMSYLSLLLGAKFRDKNVWEPVVDRVRRKLDSWKAPLLLSGASYLISLIIFSLFSIPQSIALKIERSFRNFLWNNRMDARKYHLVDWKRVCSPMEVGVWLNYIGSDNN